MKQLIFGFLLIFVLFGCAYDRTHYDANGMFEATDIMVSAQESGQLIRFDVQEGQSLRSAQSVGKIDNTQLVLRRNQLVAQLNSLTSQFPDITTQLAPLMQQLKEAQNESNRIDRLFSSGGATQQQVDQIHSQVVVFIRQLAAQQSSLRSGVSRLNNEKKVILQQIAQVNDQIRQCLVVNPINGIVLDTFVHESELVTYGKPLYSIADLRHMILRCYVISSQVQHLKIGQTVQVFYEIDAKHTRSYQGKISWISNEAEFTPKNIQTKDDRVNLVYSVKITVLNDGYLKIGMYGHVRFLQ